MNTPILIPRWALAGGLSRSEISDFRRDGFALCPIAGGAEPVKTGNAFLDMFANAPGSTYVPRVPPPPSLIDTTLADFAALIGDKDSGVAGDFFKEAERLRGIGTGADDPAFAAFKEARFGQLGAEEKSALAGNAEFFGRRGLGSSSAALNQLNKTRGGFSTARQGLTADIGIAAMTRKDQAFKDALAAESAGAETAATPAELLIARLAAENAGKGGDSGDDGGGCTILCLVLTDFLYGHGDLTSEDYLQHARVSGLKSDPALYAGYRAWADPLVRAAERHPTLYWCVRAAVRLYVLDRIGSAPTWRGRAIGMAIRGLSRTVSWFLLPPTLAGG